MSARMVSSIPGRNTLRTTSVPSARDGAVGLSDRGGGQRLGVDRAKQFPGLTLELLVQPFLNDVERYFRTVVLQLLEFVRPTLAGSGRDAC